MSEENPLNNKNLHAMLGDKFAKTDQGELDVWTSIGGIRGLIESFLPATVFLVVFILTQELWWASGGALAVGLILAVMRKLAGGSMMQVTAGLVGIAICVFVATRTGEARDYYLYGLITNAFFAPVLLISMVVRWPLIGVLYGLLRNEDFSWRQQPARLKRYQWATLIVAAVPVLRLLVQVPLYLADNVAALGITRLAMGLPLYGAALWLAWLVSAPRPIADEAAVQR